MYRMQVITLGFQGAPGYNTYYSLAGTEAAASTWAGDVSGYISGLASNLSNVTTCQFDGILEEFDPGTGQTTSTLDVGAFSVQGVNNANQSPQGTCALIRWRTGLFLNGREVRGRSYISGLADIGDGVGRITDTNLADMQTAAQILADSSTAAVYSPTNGIGAFISSANVWNQFGLMRSRRD